MHATEIRITISSTDPDPEASFGLNGPTINSIMIKNALTTAMHVVFVLSKNSCICLDVAAFCASVGTN
jgi:hypothetical protein